MHGATSRANILKLASVYGRAHGLSLEQVSKKLYGTTAFLRAFTGREATASVDKVDQLIQRFSDHWPEDLPWPELFPPSDARPKPMGKSIPMRTTTLPRRQQIT